MDGSYSPFWYVRGGIRTGFNFVLGFPVLTFPKWYFQSWPAIYFKPLVKTLQDTSHLPQTNNCLPSWVERGNQKAAPLPQGHPLCTPHHGNLVRGVTFPRTLSAAEERHWSLPGWSSFWRSHCAAEWIFAKQRYVSWCDYQQFFKNLACSCCFFT